MASLRLASILSRARENPFAHGPLPEVPDLKGLFREVRDIEPPTVARQELFGLQEVREMIAWDMAEYLSLDSPSYMKLYSILPGVGKTSAAILAAEQAALSGRRVMYSGPRHDFFADLMALSRRRALWYEWLPRQVGCEETRQPLTCHYALEISRWMQRGYRGIDFCSAICGWDFVNTRCPYHAQKERREPIIFAQHQHVVLAHPLQFSVVIGDESPVGAFCNEWEIPAEWVYVQSLNPAESIAEVLHRLSCECYQERLLKGPELLDRVGGADSVLEACRSFRVPADAATVLSPDIHRPEQVDSVPYAHLLHLAPLLAREAEACLRGEPYVHRVVAGHSKLTLLLRHPPNRELPPHVIWLDATGNKHLYEACFGREVRVFNVQPRLAAHVYQVTSRANGKASLLSTKKVHGERVTMATYRLDQMARQVRRILEVGKYKNPAVITYQGVIERAEAFRDLRHNHFYAARGTNALQDVDCLIVAGTPMPPLDRLVQMAAMLFQERMRGFDARFYTRVEPYNYVDPQTGKGKGFDTPGFWADPDLQSVLWSFREAEIIQAAHRCRPINHECDIWLLTNLPVFELPLERLLNIHELFEAPGNVRAHEWLAVLEYADERRAQGLPVTAPELASAIGCSRTTANKYVNQLKKRAGWVDVPAALWVGRRGAGRRPNAAYWAPEIDSGG